MTAWELRLEFGAELSRGIGDSSQRLQLRVSNVPCQNERLFVRTPMSGLKFVEVRSDIGSRNGQEAA